jgi:hypothetical protein
VAILLSTFVLAKKKEKQDWNKLLNDVEKDWEKGDEQEELEYEFETNRKIHQSKLPKIDMNDGAAIMEAYKKNPLMYSGGGGGQAMIFVDLKKNNPLSKTELDKLAGKWSALLRSASVPTTCYNLGENSVMVSVEKSWLANDVLKFLAKQPEVESFNANSKTYYPKDFLEDGEDEDDD